MTTTVPLTADIDRIVIITVDCLRWDYHDQYRNLYPDGVWYRGTAQATYTPTSHMSLFTGLNPQRHLVYEFGDPVQTDTLFDATDSVCFSVLGQQQSIDRHEKVLLPGLDVEHPYVAGFYDLLRPRDDNYDEFGDELFDAIAAHDVTFLHDWIVHSTDPYENKGKWNHPIADDNSRERAHDQYQKVVDHSLDAHTEFLDRMRERDLHDSTLYVVWGDHGECLFDPPIETSHHSSTPGDSQSRIPISFTSPAFDTGDTAVDETTNARSVDVLPTLASVLETAELEYQELAHEYEGVDLTTFEGELAGYTTSPPTTEGQIGAIDDAVRTSQYASIQNPNGTPQLYRSDGRHSDSAAMVATTNQMVLNKLDHYHDRVTDGADKLVYRHQPDEDWLRSMGYLD